MIQFFITPQDTFIALYSIQNLNQEDIEKLIWLFGEAKKLDDEVLTGWFVGPRKEMLTPWSTNAVEITQNMGIQGIERIEEYILLKYPPYIQKPVNISHLTTLVTL